MSDQNVTPFPRAAVRPLPRRIPPKEKRGLQLVVIGLITRLGPAWAYDMLLDEAEVIRVKMLAGVKPSDDQTR